VDTEPSNGNVWKMLLGAIDPYWDRLSEDASSDNAPLELKKNGWTSAPTVSTVTPQEKPIYKCNGQGFEELEKGLSEASKRRMEWAPQLLHENATTKLTASWDAPDAMKRYREGALFEAILTLSGDSSNAQAATCTEYMKEQFSKAGSLLLNTIQRAWSSISSKPEADVVTATNSEGSLGVEFSEGGSDIVVRAGGRDADDIYSETAIFQLCKAFAWLCAALRVSSQDELSLSTFRFSISASCIGSAFDLSVRIDLLPLITLSKNAGMCWHSLFKCAIVVYGAPIRERQSLREACRGTLPVLFP